MAAFKQENRPLRIQTPLGDDVLLIKSLTGTERLGRPFKYDLVLASTEQDLDYKKILGQNVTVFLDKGDKEPRWFNGYISRFAQTTFEGRLIEYRATLVPWLWFLSRSSDCRVFQNMSIPEIVKQVFQDHGFTDVVERIYGSYRQWDYCVQYRETAFDFISRLMEEEGIYYFFKHENDKHSLVMCDSPGSHKEFKGYEQLTYHPTSAAGAETLDHWHIHHEVQTGVYTTSNYDFTTPRKNTVANSVEDRDYSQSNLEQYDYLGEQSPFTEGERYSKLRLEEQQAQYEVYSGEGDARGVCTGVRFALKGHPRSDFEQDYLTTGADYHIEAGSFESADEKEQGFKFRVKMTAIALSQQFRPARVTPKPIAHGPQTAVVVGPSGQTVYTDQYGRVKVQFHWDRLGTSDQNSSCWIRVSQKWASNGWGDMAIPHVGDEVIVECLEGDPDRPVITGCLYNEVNTPPLDLSTNKNKRIMQDDYGNRIVFDATPGDEHIRIFSPHHNSGITYGRSLCSFTESNTDTAVLGNVFACVIGATLDMYAGCYWEQVFGVNIESTLGATYNINIGSTVNFNLGTQYNLASSVTFEEQGQDFYKVCNKNAIISSAQTVNVIGGAGHLNGTSVMRATSDLLELSVGESLPVSPPTYSTRAKVITALTAITPLLAAALAVSAGGYITTPTNNPEDVTLQNSLSGQQIALETTAGVLEAVSLVIALAASKICAANQVDTKLVAHDNGNFQSRLQLNADGNTELEADGRISVLAAEKNAAIIMDEDAIQISHEEAQITLAAGVDNGITITQEEVSIGGTQITINAPDIDLGDGALTIVGGSVPIVTTIQESIAELEATDLEQQAELTAIKFEMLMANMEALAAQLE